MSTMPSKSDLTVMVVEDSRIERMVLEQQIADLGHVAVAVENAEAALEAMRARAPLPDIVLTDRMMPGMDGVGLVNEMKADRTLRKIPVVMITGADSSTDIADGMNAGVFYYLPKPAEEGVLRSVLGAAARTASQTRNLAEELKRHKRAFDLMTTCKCQFNLLEEAEALALFAANCFPEPSETLDGIMELLVNGLEHGLLGIGYEKKSRLMGENRWYEEIQERSKRAQGEGRFVEMAVARRNGAVYLVVTDPGLGFDWRRYLTIDPSRASDTHGRGIARAATMCFDKLTFNEKGNQVVAAVSLTRRDVW